MVKKREILNSIEFWEEYHKKGYNSHHKLPIGHILIVLDKIKKGETDK